eukprot:6518302-Karenia_brevis.AAC.1
MPDSNGSWTSSVIKALVSMRSLGPLPLANPLDHASKAPTVGWVRGPHGFGSCGELFYGLGLGPW